MNLCYVCNIYRNANLWKVRKNVGYYLDDMIVGHYFALEG